MLSPSIPQSHSTLCCHRQSYNHSQPYAVTVNPSITVNPTVIVKLTVTVNLLLFQHIDLRQGLGSRHGPTAVLRPLWCQAMSTTDNTLLHLSHFFTRPLVHLSFLSPIIITFRYSTSHVLTFHSLSSRITTNPIITVNTNTSTFFSYTDFCMGEKALILHFE